MMNKTQIRGNGINLNDRNPNKSMKRAFTSSLVKCLGRFIVSNDNVSIVVIEGRSISTKNHPFYKNCILNQQNINKLKLDALSLYVTKYSLGLNRNAIRDN